MSTGSSRQTGVVIRRSLFLPHSEIQCDCCSVRRDQRRRFGPPSLVFRCHDADVVVGPCRRPRRRRQPADVPPTVAACCAEVSRADEAAACAKTHMLGARPRSAGIRRRRLPVVNELSCGGLPPARRLSRQRRGSSVAQRQQAAAARQPGADPSTTSRRTARLVVGAGRRKRAHDDLEPMTSSRQVSRRRQRF